MDVLQVARGDSAAACLLRYTLQRLHCDAYVEVINKRTLQYIYSEDYRYIYVLPRSHIFAIDYTYSSRFNSTTKSLQHGTYEATPRGFCR